MSDLKLNSAYVKPVAVATAGALAGAAAKPVYNFLKTNFHAGLKEGATVDTFVKKGAEKVGGLLATIKNAKFTKSVMNLAEKAVNVVKKPFVALGKTKLIQNKFVQGIATNVGKVLAKPYVKGALLGAAIATAAYFVTSYIQDKLNK